MTPSSPNLRLFIDLENVAWAKPDVCGEPFEHVTLFIGPKQAKLNVEWTQLCIDHPGKIDLIRLTASPPHRLTASAPNALDFILACHLGRTTLQHPEASYCIISNDKGFDPLTKHLDSIGITISRHSIESPSKACEASPPSNITPFPLLTVHSEEARQFLTKLGISRPKKRTTLASTLAAKFRPQNLAPKEIEALIDNLKKSRYLTITSAGAVAYPLKSHPHTVGVKALADH